jgi:hypothetical protein
VSQQDWINKVMTETPLTAEETLLLEQELASQEDVRSLVAALPQPEPSMAWRSALNEELMKAAPKPSRKTWLYWGSGALVGGLACWLAFAVLIPASLSQGLRETSQANNEALAQDLLQGHENDSSAVLMGIAAPDLMVLNSSD